MDDKFYTSLIHTHSLHPAKYEDGYIDLSFIVVLSSASFVSCGLSTTTQHNGNCRQHSMNILYILSETSLFFPMASEYPHELSNKRRENTFKLQYRNFMPMKAKPKAKNQISISLILTYTANVIGLIRKYWPLLQLAIPGTEILKGHLICAYIPQIHSQGPKRWPHWVKMNYLCERY